MEYHVGYVDGLDDDLRALHEADPAEYALWDALLDLVWTNDLALGELFFGKTVFKGTPRFDTEAIWSFVNNHRCNISRVKLLRNNGTAASSYRLWYCTSYTPVAKVTLLGLMPRAANYASENTVVARCLVDYDKLGIPRLPAAH